jgi:hypothetical protein
MTGNRGSGGTTHTPRASFPLVLGSIPVVNFNEMPHKAHTHARPPFTERLEPAAAPLSCCLREAEPRFAAALHWFKKRLVARDVHVRTHNFHHNERCRQRWQAHHHPRSKVRLQRQPHVYGFRIGQRGDGW